MWWTILGLFSPTLIASMGWVWASKKAAKFKAEVKAKDDALAVMASKLAEAEADTARANATINHMSEVYSEMDRRRISAEAKADSFQMAAAELARQTAANPDADAAAREVAKHLQELLNDTP